MNVVLVACPGRVVAQAIGWGADRRNGTAPWRS
jgi:hypothetical protein